MNRAVIFDLDQTLLDTSSLQHLRDARQWSSIYGQLTNLVVAQQITDLMEYLRDNSIKIIIITTSPSSYCTSIVKHFKWQVDGQICYHDVSRRKPDPEAFAKAVKDYRLDVTKTISAGDRDIDVRASKAISIPAIACTWGSPDEQSLLSSEPTYIAHTPEELSIIIKRFFH